MIPDAFDISEVAEALARPVNGTLRLRRLALAVANCRLPSEDCREWLSMATHHHLTTHASMDESLGLKISDEARQLRDDALMLAFIALGDEFSVSHRIRLILEAARHMEAVHHVIDEDVMDRWPIWKVHVAVAVLTAPLPGDRRLRQICTMAADFKNPDLSWRGRIKQGKFPAPYLTHHQESPHE